MIYTKKFWKATAVRLARTFLTTILGVFTAGKLITDIDWKTTLLAALTSTLSILILCLISGLPEVDKDNELEFQKMDKPELPEDYFESKKEDGDE